MLGFGAALYRLHSYLVNRRFGAEEEFFPGVPAVLCDYIKSEHCRGKTCIKRSALMLQRYPPTPFSESFKSPVRYYLPAFKNGVRLYFRISIYCDLGFLELIISNNTWLGLQKFTSCSHKCSVLMMENWRGSNLTHYSRLVAYLICTYLKKEVCRVESAQALANLIHDTQDFCCRLFPSYPYLNYSWQSVKCVRRWVGEAVGRICRANWWRGWGRLKDLEAAGASWRLMKRFLIWLWYKVTHCLTY